MAAPVPRHWAERYVGMLYQPGENDCASFAVRVQREVYGHDVSLPAEHATGLRSASAQIEALKSDYAEPVARPQEGDAVLMRSRGSLNHIGVYCEIGGAGYVLHAMRTPGQVCLHRVCDLPKFGLAVEGFYRWV